MYYCVAISLILRHLDGRKLTKGEGLYNHMCIVFSTPSITIVSCYIVKDPLQYYVRELLDVN